MKLGRSAYAPIGYLDFCERRPDQCPPQDAMSGAASTQAGDGQIVTASLGLGGETAATRPQAAFGPPWGASRGRKAVRPLPYSPALMAQLDEVNRRINAAIRPATDMQTHGTSDHWDLPLDPGGGGAGDCEDYALQKREALAGLGFAAGDLSMAVVRTRWGEIHAVLLVTTEAGEYVLDNIAPDVRLWRSLDYAWIVRQAPGGGPTDWVSVTSNNPGA
jgi:predicted transglutaminase-like cysteine proteinase